MLILELGEVVNVLVNDDVEVGRLVVRRDVGSRKYLGHDYEGCSLRCRTDSKQNKRQHGTWEQERE